MSKDWVQDMEAVQRLYDCTANEVGQMDDGLLRRFIEFRIRFLQEELDELYATCQADEMVDALIDLTVVAIGTLVCMGIDVNKAWDEVLAANLAKVKGINRKRPNPLGLPDLVKPDGWVPPCHNHNVGLFERLQAAIERERILLGIALTRRMEDGPC